MFRFFDRDSKRSAPLDWREEAERMVDSQIRARGVDNERVLDAMRRIPRHCFVPDDRRDEAYCDEPLAIGHNQTISQPYIVAVMTDLLEPQPTDKILEIGTGSGYQAAVLAELVDHVHSVELIAPLANRADEVLRSLGYDNVTVHVGDGRLGWPDEAPYDGILVTAAPEELPNALAAQVKPGRVIVAPVGPIRDQVLMVYEKQPDGSLQPRSVFEVRFVPLIGHSVN